MTCVPTISPLSLTARAGHVVGKSANCFRYCLVGTAGEGCLEFNLFRFALLQKRHQGLVVKVVHVSNITQVLTRQPRVDNDIRIPLYSGPSDISVSHLCNGTVAVDVVRGGRTRWVRPTFLQGSGTCIRRAAGCASTTPSGVGVPTVSPRRQVKDGSWM